MTLASLERKIAEEVAVLIKNPKFKRKDIMEWATADCKPQEGETQVKTPNGFFVCFKKELDKRED